MRVSAFVGDNLREPEHFVAFDDPKAVGYVLGHLESACGSQAGKRRATVGKRPPVPARPSVG